MEGGSWWVNGGGKLVGEWRGGGKLVGEWRGEVGG